VRNAVCVVKCLLFSVYLVYCATRRPADCTLAFGFLCNIIGPLPPAAAPAAPLPALAACLPPQAWSTLAKMCLGKPSCASACIECDQIGSFKTVPQTCLHLCALPMGNSYWSKACSAQAARTPLQLQQANYGGCIFAVSAAFGAALCCVAARARGHLLWV
jgi:hypothetical protein